MERNSTTRSNHISSDRSNIRQHHGSFLDSSLLSKFKNTLASVFQSRGEARPPRLVYSVFCLSCVFGICARGEGCARGLRHLLFSWPFVVHSSVSFTFSPLQNPQQAEGEERILHSPPSSLTDRL